MSVEDYFNKLMALYDELERLKSLHSCSCGLCTCNVVDKFRQDWDEEKLHQFYIGIDDDAYATVRANLLSQTPAPDLERAYQTFLQEERSPSIARTKIVPDESHAFALVDARKRGPASSNARSDKSTLVCSYCKKRGHDQSSCFNLHGIPLWYVELQKTLKGKSVQPAGSTTPSAGAAATPAGAFRGRPSTLQAHAIQVAASNVYLGDGLLPLPTSAAVPPSVPLSSSTEAAVPSSHASAPSSNAIAPSSHAAASILATLSNDPVQSLLIAINSEKFVGDRMIGPNFEDADWSR